MIELFEPTVDPRPTARARQPRACCATFNQAGVLTAADVHVAHRDRRRARRDRRRAAARGGARRPRGPRRVGVRRPGRRARARAPTCRGRTRTAGARPWPRVHWSSRRCCTWRATCSTSTATGAKRGRWSTTCSPGRPPRAGRRRGRAGRRRWTALPRPGYAEQRAAGRGRAAQWTTVLTGGPGTGKTTTVARAARPARRAVRPTPLRIALAAPTGKAAARLAGGGARRAAEAAAERPGPTRHGLEGTTLHRLLGAGPTTATRFRHHRGNRLPHDVIVVDETSMVSLTMMARLLEAVRPDTRLVFVGDPDQLVSVEAGAVLADLVDGWPTCPTRGRRACSPTIARGRRSGRLPRRCGPATPMR